MPFLNHKDILCNDTYFAATISLPGSFVAPPEFNDVDTTQPESVKKHCKVSQLKSRLNPTFRISASLLSTNNDNFDIFRVCGFSRESLQAGDQSGYSLDDSSDPYETFESLTRRYWFLNVRFPVISNIRTTEDRYATLMCSYETGLKQTSNLRKPTSKHVRERNQIVSTREPSLIKASARQPDYVIDSEDVDSDKSFNSSLLNLAGKRLGWTTRKAANTWWTFIVPNSTDTQVGVTKADHDQDIDSGKKGSLNNAGQTSSATDPSSDSRLHSKKVTNRHFEDDNSDENSFYRSETNDRIHGNDDWLADAELERVPLSVIHANGSLVPDASTWWRESRLRQQANNQRSGSADVHSVANEKYTKLSKIDNEEPVADRPPPMHMESSSSVRVIFTEPSQLFDVISNKSHKNHLSLEYGSTTTTTTKAPNKEAPGASTSILHHTRAPINVTAQSSANSLSFRRLNDSLLISKVADEKAKLISELLPVTRSKSNLSAPKSVTPKRDSYTRQGVSEEVRASISLLIICVFAGAALAWFVIAVVILFLVNMY